ncbi:unnamed protein product [Adineta steineri]|uniref:BED-type domain-containing protein n=1 Tax=Adineta steineri TaxID=433720 RepID=A0A815TGM5_9BILA|nr:unnamed protein product [Adineta steineri]
MAPSRKSISTRSATSAATNTTQRPQNFDDNLDEEPIVSQNVTHVSLEEIDEDSNSSNNVALVPEDDNTNSTNQSGGTKLRSNVWGFAQKITKNKAYCPKCKIYIKTINGGTSTLRKHLLLNHDLVQLQLASQPRNKPTNSIPREKKQRLDHLANLAIFEDGRTFGDFRKSGISKFITEGIPDNSNNNDDDDDDDDEENRDLILDSWDDEVITGDDYNRNDDNDDNDQNIAISQIQLAKTIQKGRSLIKLIKRSQIIMMYINNEKKLSKVQRRLTTDCMSRWNSTFLSLQRLLEHKPILNSLFENKGKLPLTNKQKEKLGLSELSSDDYMIFTDLLKIFEPFDDATKLLSASKYPTIGLCLYVTRFMKDFLETEGEDDSNILITLKSFVLESFNKYFDEKNHQHFLLTLYGYLDPYGYSSLLPNERSKVERFLKQKYKDQTKSQAPPTTTTTTTTSSSTSTSSTTSTSGYSSVQKPTLLEKFLKSVGKSVPSRNLVAKTISEEIGLYGNLCKSEPLQDCVTFWRNHGQKMPILKTMAQQYLATPGTSVPSESAFSTSSYIGRKERSRLSPENLCYTVFLQDKLRSS